MKNIATTGEITSVGQHNLYIVVLKVLLAVIGQKFEILSMAVITRVVALARVVFHRMPEFE